MLYMVVNFLFLKAYVPLQDKGKYFQVMSDYPLVIIMAFTQFPEMMPILLCVELLFLYQS